MKIKLTQFPQCPNSILANASASSTKKRIFFSGSSGGIAHRTDS